MTLMTRLKREAKDSLQWEAHKMGKFYAIEEDTAEADCERCGAYVAVIAAYGSKVYGGQIVGNVYSTNCR